MIATKILLIVPPAFLLFTASAQTQTIHTALSAGQPDADGIVPMDGYYEETGTVAEGVGEVDSTAMLAAHNRWRAAVGVPDLVWSESLAETAQSWANHLSRSGCCGLSHSSCGYGENIYKVSSVVWANGRREIQSRTPNQVVDGWATEDKNYNYARNTCSGICGHYTQIIWRDSEELGCGAAVCPDKSQIWVCNYAPTGNVEGQRPY